MILKTLTLLLILISTSMACDPSCKYCAADGITCEGCFAGYIFSSETPVSCEPCPAGFTSEEGSSTCTACPAGLWANPGDSECASCGDNCDVCSSSTTCQVCSFQIENINGKCLYSCPQGENTAVSFGDCANGECGMGCYECAYSGYDCFSCYYANEGQNENQYLVCSQSPAEEATPSLLSSGISLASVSKSSASGLGFSSVIAKSFSAGSSVAFRFGVVAEVIRNARYFSIPYSKKTENIFAQGDSDPLEVNAPESFGDEGSKAVHRNFAKYNVDPDFLTNYWNDMVTILILCACLALFKLSEIYLLKSSTRTWPQKTLRILKICGANFLINNLYGSFDKILLFFILEIQTCSFGSVFSWTSFIIALGFLVIGLGFFGFHFHVLKKYQAAKSNNGAQDQEGNKDSQKKLKAFRYEHAHVKVFYEDFKDDSLSQQSFLASLMIRSSILSIFLCLLVGNPLVEAGLFLGVNLAFAIFLVIKRPFDELKNAIAQYFCEIIILITYSGVFALALIDHNSPGASNSREFLEKSIVILGIALNIGGIFFQCIDIFVAFYEAYESFKAWRANAKVTPASRKERAKNSATDTKESPRTLNPYTPSLTPSGQNLSEGKLANLPYSSKDKALLDMPSFALRSQSLNTLLESEEGCETEADKGNNKPIVSIEEIVIEEKDNEGEDSSRIIEAEGANVVMSPYKNGVSHRVMGWKGSF